MHRVQRRIKFSLSLAENKRKWRGKKFNAKTVELSIVGCCSDGDIICICYIYLLTLLDRKKNRKLELCTKECSTAMVLSWIYLLILVKHLALEHFHCENISVDSVASDSINAIRSSSFYSFCIVGVFKVWNVHSLFVPKSNLNIVKVFHHFNTILSLLPFLFFFFFFLPIQFNLQHKICLFFDLFFARLRDWRHNSRWHHKNAWCFHIDKTIFKLCVCVRLLHNTGFHLMSR